MTRTRGVVLVAVVVVTVTLGIAGYGLVRGLIQDKVDHLLARVTAGLPPGTTLEWEAMRLNPLGLSVTLDRVHLANPSQRLDGAVGQMTVSHPRLDGTRLAAIDLDLVDVALAAEREGRPLSVRLATARIETLRPLETLALVRRLKDVTGLDDLDPDLIAQLSLGPVTLADMAVDVGGTPDLHGRFGRLALEGIDQGRVSVLSAARLSAQVPDAAVSLDSLRLEGLDLPRVVRWLRRTRGQVLTADGRPDLDSFGLGRLTLDGVGATVEGRHLALDRLAVTDFVTDRGAPVRLDLDLAGARVPPDLLDRDNRAFLARHGLEELVVHAHWAHDLNDGRQSLRLGPLTLGAEGLGAVSGSLEVAGVSLSTLLAAVTEPDRLLNEARFAGATFAADSGRATGAYLDFLLAQDQMTRADLARLIETGIGQDLVDTLGADLGARLVGALVGFVEAPGALRLSTRALDAPMNLTQLSIGLALVPDQVLAAYDVQISHTPP